MAIERKDIQEEKSIYEHLLHDADCLEVIRSHSWVFDSKYLDLKDKDTPKLKLLVQGYRIALAQMGDAPKEGSFNLQTKRIFEHNPSGYARLRELLIRL